MDTTALLCNICPKRPKFSDISHLLTHVASKAHLSHYFKLQVRSHQESQAIVILDEYDHWYKSNNLAKLLSDRMSSKDVRKKKAQGKPPSYEMACGVKRSSGGRLPPTTARPLAHNAFPDYLDPRLSSPYVHPRSGVESGPANEPSHFHSTAPSEESIREYQREDYSLALMTPQEDTCPPKQEYPLPFEDQWASMTHASPYELARKPIHRTAPSPPSLARQLSYDPFTDDADGIEEDKERADEIARLKGVLWPGMDIFDSATEHMRRKRNQKKDEAILKMMEKTSLRVEPTELVFSPSGVLRKQRVISGNVEDSSPLKGETPIPKRRTIRTKRALAQADPNVRQGGNRKRSKKSTKKVLGKVDEDPDFHGLHLLQSPLAQLPVRYRSRSRADSLDDFTLTFRTQESESHHGLKIFHDRQAPYMSDLTQRCGEIGSEGPSFIDPVSLRQGALDQSSPHFVYSTEHSIHGRGAFSSTDKENVEPLLDGHDRVDSLVGWNSPVCRRQPAANTGYPPHFFLGDSQQQMGLSPFDSHDSLLGYSYNPLTTSLSNIHEDNPIYSAEVNQSFKSHSTLRGASPDGTISDLEEDDFDRLYLDGSIN
ncbi:hypothetical protein P168DRAFT_274909 [Aspergillus campestris IBT 28561]|uniref:Uncharacterized protein n=1 Tax=Aspergillus campestris (strain IBT 28561) TaxID=1392248 RepID=A0A2I1CUD7_ASPC2|nr:uncharacterized protein P168DRAFT_274909 [Aspergillus campestris IBT 28561]PKY01242.1 hypothetical protein P168DRAFT_274909 [Aspergillus campestris IBT 28561]